MLKNEDLGNSKKKKNHAKERRFEKYRLRFLVRIIHQCHNTDSITQILNDLCLFFL